MTQNKPMKILVCGDRHYKDYNTVERWLRAAGPSQDITIIQGGGTGVDTIVRQVAPILGYTLITVPAKWHWYGKAAGPIRNKEMLKLKPDLVLAFHDYIDNSRGTKNMVEQAKKAGIHTKVIAKRREDNDN